ncbi:MAG: lipopolysaccharide heptosyltransferase II [Thauera sp.]|jgi:heptosyltransferase II|nr:lipopolysaccharide heptosyltransferase II [Thauera sp.]
MQDRARHILVVGPSWVGDMVMAQSLFKALKLRGAEAIDVLAPGWSLPILERMPEVRRGVVMPLGHGEFGFSARRALGHSLRGEGYQQAIVLPGSLKSALVPFFARIPQRTGFRGEMRYGLLNDLRLLDKQALPMTVQRFVALAGPADAALPDSLPSPLPLPRLVAQQAQQPELRARHHLATDIPAVAFMPGAEYGPAKQWPIPHFAALARLLASQGFQVWVLGSNKDQAAGEQIAAGNSAVHNLAGKTSLGDAVDLLAMCAGAVSNDSGLMHVAAALDVPLVAIYGSSSPEHTPPLADKVAIETLRLDCSPCFKRECPLGHTRCLTDILPGRILAALAGLGLPCTPLSRPAGSA